MTSGDGKFLAVPETGRLRGPDSYCHLARFLAGRRWPVSDLPGLNAPDVHFVIGSPPFTDEDSSFRGCKKQQSPGP